GASSLRLPVIPAFVDSIKSRITNSIKADRDRTVVGVPLSDGVISPSLIDPETSQPFTWRDMAERLQQYCLFEISPAGDVDLNTAIDHGLDDCLLTGTTVLKGIWDRQRVIDRSVEGTPVEHIIHDNFRP